MSICRQLIISDHPLVLRFNDQTYMPEIGTTDFRILIRMIITPDYEEFLDFPHIFQEILEEWTPD